MKRPRTRAQYKSKERDTKIPAFQATWEEQAEHSNKGSRRNDDVTKWKLVIRDGGGIFWIGTGWSTNLWDAKIYQCMADARADFMLVKAHGGCNIGVKRVRMFCADRNPKHVIEGIAP